MIASKVGICMQAGGFAPEAPHQQLWNQWNSPSQQGGFSRDPANQCGRDIRIDKELIVAQLGCDRMKSTDVRHMLLGIFYPRK